MTQSDKDLLLKDLCARLPYGVKVNIPSDYPFNPPILEGIRYDGEIIVDKIRAYDFGYYKLYLRPISSMTYEEKKEIRRFFRNCIDELHEISDVHEQFFLGFCQDAASLDYLNSHHFDYRGLIEKGLALPAPEGMYKEE